MFGIMKILTFLSLLKLGFGYDCTVCCSPETYFYNYALTTSSIMSSTQLIIAQEKYRSRNVSSLFLYYAYQYSYLARSFSLWSGNYTAVTVFTNIKAALLLMQLADLQALITFQINLNPYLSVKSYFLPFIIDGVYNVNSNVKAIIMNNIVAYALAFNYQLSPLEISEINMRLKIDAAYPYYVDVFDQLFNYIALIARLANMVNFLNTVRDFNRASLLSLPSSSKNKSNNKKAVADNKVAVDDNNVAVDDNNVSMTDIVEAPVLKSAMFNSSENENNNTTNDFDSDDIKAMEEDKDSIVEDLVDETAVYVSDEIINADFLAKLNLDKEKLILQTCYVDLATADVSNDFSKITDLHIIDCEIVEDKPAFQNFIGLFANIKNLKISQCALKKVPVFVKNYLGLVNLDLSENQLSEITEEDVNGFTQIESLNLAFNKIAKVASFKKLEKLKTVDLSNNLGLEKSTVEVLQSIYKASNLENLILKSNNLVQLLENAPLMKKLKLIDYSDNKIAKVDSRIVKLPSLETIIIRSNKFEPLMVTDRLYASKSIKKIDFTGTTVASPAKVLRSIKMMKNLEYFNVNNWETSMNDLNKILVSGFNSSVEEGSIQISLIKE